MRRLIIAAILIIPTLLVAACNSSQPPSPVSSATSGSQTSKGTPAAPLKIQETPAIRSVLSGLPSETAGGNYKIIPMDKLDISVFQVPDLARTVEVNQSGMISLPLIGLVQASGLTAEQLQANIEHKLAAEYLQDPQVLVSIREYSSRRVTVSGSVQKPGVFPLTGETTLMQAIAMAGGMTANADRGAVLIFRQSGTTRQVAKFDVGLISEAKAPDPYIEPGDIIILNSSAVKTLIGSVKELIPIAGFFIAISSL